MLRPTWWQQHNQLGCNSACYNKVHRNSCYNEAGRISYYDKASLNSYYNTFGCNSYYNTFGCNSYYNTFGCDSYYNKTGCVGILLRILQTGPRKLFRYQNRNGILMTNNVSDIGLACMCRNDDRVCVGTIQVLTLCL